MNWLNSNIIESSLSPVQIENKIKVSLVKINLDVNRIVLESLRDSVESLIYKVDDKRSQLWSAISTNITVNVDSTSSESRLKVESVRQNRLEVWVMQVIELWGARIHSLAKQISNVCSHCT